MSDRDREFLRYYKENRIADQDRYYVEKSTWHQRRASVFILVAGTVMFLSTAASWAVSNLLAPTELWTVLATIMPAISGAIVAVRALYEYNRNHTRFLNTYYDLRQAAVESRPADDLSGEKLRDATVKFVTEIENLLSRENRQWVKMMSTPAQSRQSEGG